MGLRWGDSVPEHNKGFKDGNSSAATASILWASEGGTVYLHTLDNSRKEQDSFLYSEKKTKEETKNIGNEEGTVTKKKICCVLASKSTLSVSTGNKQTVFWIRAFLLRIRILGSVHRTKDPDPDADPAFFDSGF